MWPVLTTPAGHPGHLVAAEQPGPAGEAGQSGGIGPATDAREVTDAEIIELSLSESGRFGVIFERHADEILRYVHARLGPDLAERPSVGITSPPARTGRAENWRPHAESSPGASPG
jgi:hypothetical protein